MNENKLANALAFLSLDALSPFWDRLSIASSVNDWRLANLRDILKNCVCHQQFCARFQELCGNVYYSLQHGDAQELWFSIWSWSDSVYLFGGEDRKPEQIWSLILAELWSQGQKISDISPKLISRLVAIQEQIINERTRIVPHLIQLRSASLSEWDALVLPQIYLEPDFLADRIDLIISYNQLVKSWKRNANFQMQELWDIHEWGKKRAVHLGMREVDIPYPGCWDYVPYDVRC